jgi:hypothetical protein
MQTCDQMIEEMVVAIAGPIGSARKAHHLKTSLQLLVRMAKAEYVLEMKMSVALAMGDMASGDDKRKSKAAARHLLASLQSKQRKLDFESGGLH